MGPRHPAVPGVLHEVILIARVVLRGVVALQGPIPHNPQERLPEPVDAGRDVLLDRAQVLERLAAVVRVRDGDAEVRVVPIGARAVVVAVRVQDAPRWGAAAGTRC